MISSGRCVVLDGATGTELPHVTDAEHALDERLWGTRALLEDSAAVLELHREYVNVGCDVISTNTWGLPSALLSKQGPVWNASQPVHWMDIARRGVQVARQAVEDGSRRDQCAVAFSLNGDIDSEEDDETVRLLARVFADEPPDLILLETLSVVSPSLYLTIERLLGIGLPVWLSFRRCRHGLCSVYGQHWGGPEGDAFGRAAARFEEMGVAALMVNCIPPDHVDGMVSYLRDFTDLPLGVYPNLGYYTDQGWRSDAGVGGPEYAQMALRWRGEGAQIIGGCCGVGPVQVDAARRVLRETKPGHRRAEEHGQAVQEQVRATAPKAWTDRRGSTVYPVPFPEIVCDPGVWVPQGGTLMVWRYLLEQRIGAHQRCLDVGAGSGILAVQLALNGATHVHAIDVDGRAIANINANAFRNGVADVLSAAEVDLHPWVPAERYEVIVASLFQSPADPLEHLFSHRPVDYWGRSLIDQLLTKLPDALAPEGVAYVMHLSVLSQTRTDQILEQVGLESRVVDYGLFPFPPLIAHNRTQVGRVEEQSDAYHLRIGDDDVLISYLLEIKRRDGGAEAASGIPR
jgi:S-methylmethionine-dependent homocysteine/selenocysteine methylase/SAM-dependent methyltransferase